MRLVLLGRESPRGSHRTFASPVSPGANENEEGTSGSVSVAEYLHRRVVTGCP